VLVGKVTGRNLPLFLPPKKPRVISKITACARRRKGKEENSFHRKGLCLLTGYWTVLKREVKRIGEVKCHPLAGRSSRHRPSRGEEFLFLLPLIQLLSV
jgi:hypothetical protein